MKILLVVDVQNDFVTGALANTEAQKRIPRIKEKIQQRIAEGWQVMFTQDTHYNNYNTSMEGKYLPVPHCIENTWGWQLVDEIKELEESTLHMPICKNRFGDDYLFENILKRLFPSWRQVKYDTVEEIELIGFCTDICVVSNALILKAGADDETIVSCDASCCAGTTPEAHEAALRVMKSCQVEVINE
jgi:nicotinamidase-related amidase